MQCAWCAYKNVQNLVASTSNGMCLGLDFMETALEKRSHEAEQALQVSQM